MFVVYIKRNKIELSGDNDLISINNSEIGRFVAGLIER